ncbi:hypothetical protein [Candidatus Rhabdochlamydia porcellionis]|jgi:hypothetical protein|uniref:Uncharacterized protein n=1 Tax=Candidatus Rhabdochlamydia porcellionis TaxID=225148 RepID=A0ABX8YZY8_9BACT|nr:hypothetical protein [Candidatus Rhabdochlamydia porcellionis]QZA58966.1 hypothetical protein RHAB15C_0000849 [Candidatus Rhabdochlamydia porcellionis]
MPSLSKHPLTNEYLRGLFKSNFELANQIIELARFYIRSGREVNLTKLLDETKRNPQKDYIEVLSQLDSEE